MGGYETACLSWRGIYETYSAGGLEALKKYLGDWDKRLLRSMLFLSPNLSEWDVDGFEDDELKDALIFEIIRSRGRYPSLDKSEKEYSPGELSALLRIPPGHVINRIISRELSGEQRFTQWIVTETDLQRYLDRKGRHPEECICQRCFENRIPAELHRRPHYREPEKKSIIEQLMGRSNRPRD